MRLGIDLGGTKIEAIVLDGDGRTRFRQRIASPRNDYHGTLKALTQLIHAAESAAQQKCSIGIGIPGSISKQSGRIKNANSTWLIGQDLQADLEQSLNTRVRLANDADCFALSEAIDGAAQGANSVFGVILGTGCGGGIIIQQQPLQGINAIAGEWGHNPLPWPNADELPGRPCYCGKHGCIETWLSGPGLLADHQQQHPNSNYASARQLAEAASAGEPQAEASIQRYSKRLARSLASVINILDPEVIVLGGGVSNIDTLYPQTAAKLPDYVFSDRVETRLLKAKHGDSSGVRGAAWLWPNTP